MLESYPQLTHEAIQAAIEN
ncbi:hypothetical protein JYQ62_20850 [Nostoc sp. UHCC 0702]|nr:hypothetical protein JYQ62_20850 [Nostoc sp. UHCC 0702]